MTTTTTITTTTTTTKNSINLKCDKRDRVLYFLSYLLLF